MTTGYGLGLFFLGTTLSVLGFMIAYMIGGRPSKKEEELNEAQKTLLKIKNKDIL
tara:strand:+ start:1031 stop:1195 length:165 start_codon:yes stop_codon:yes gene_type:complete